METKYNNDLLKDNLDVVKNKEKKHRKELNNVFNELDHEKLKQKHFKENM